MKKWITKALTKKRWAKKGKRRELKLIEEPPSSRLVLITMFSIAAIAALTVIEVVHMVVLGSWNSEVFIAISGVIGTLSGIVIGQKA